MHVGLALLDTALLGRLFVATHPLDLERVVLEDLDGARHLAEFVAAPGAGNFRLQIVKRERLHRGLQQLDRSDNAELADQIARGHTEQDARGRDDHHQPRTGFILFAGLPGVILDAIDHPVRHRPNAGLQLLCGGAALHR